MAAIFVLAAILDLKKCHPTFLRSLWYRNWESTDNLLLANIIHESNFNYITAYTIRRSYENLGSNSWSLLTTTLTIRMISLDSCANCGNAVLESHLAVKCDGITVTHIVRRSLTKSIHSFVTTMANPWPILDDTNDSLDSCANCGNAVLESHLAVKCDGITVTHIVRRSLTKSIHSFVTTMANPCTGCVGNAQCCFDSCLVLSLELMRHRKG